MIQMNKNRYDASESEEGQYEPGSNDQVLKNLLGITNPNEMEKVETKALEIAFKTLADTYERDHRFAAENICLMHKTWLGKVYSWAGQYRNSTLSKDGFLFAAAREVSRLMLEFEKKILSTFTPAHFQGDELIHALAIVHVELVLIHPFREGNGRISRLLSDLMCLQAGLPPLEYGIIKGEEKIAYFKAVQAGLDRNYNPMEAVFKKIIENSL